MNPKKTILLCLAMLLLAVGALFLIFNTEPTAQRETETRATAMLVETLKVERGTFRPEFHATGTVSAAKDIVLSPRVRGEVIERAAAFTPGSAVGAGTVLLRLDPADYENALRQRKSELRQARTDLKLEQGRQNVAREDYDLLAEPVEGLRRALVLREPQLAAAEVRVDAAEAAVAQAELDLARTTIRAPFDALILSREVNLGSQVAPGEPIARLVGTDEYWVTAAVPLSKIRWIRFPEADGGDAAAARVRNPSAWPPGVFRNGTVFRLIGALDGQTRLARILIRVPDPLARATTEAGAPQLIIGAFHDVHIEGAPIESVVRLERDYLRRDDTVWVKEADRLRIRDVEILLRDARYAYIRSGLEDGASVVTTHLATVVDGARLRLAGGEDAGNTPTPLPQGADE